MKNLRETIIEKEKLLFLFQIRQSTAGLEKLLSKEFIEIGESGSIQNFTSTLKSLKSECNWSCETSDWEFRQLGDDIVQILYGALITSGDEEIGVLSKRSSIWRKESGEWKMIFHQGTIISSNE